MSKVPLLNYHMYSYSANKATSLNANWILFAHVKYTAVAHLLVVEFPRPQNSNVVSIAYFREFYQGGGLIPALELQLYQPKIRHLPAGANEKGRE